MENLRECPICLEIPEKEIYQCSEGHIICSVCIEKVTECPQCRTNYGVKRIRCRVLETILDDQMFDCKFNENGCRHLCQRSHISNHINSCEFNPHLLPLCEMLGYSSCRFKIDGGGGSKFGRSEILNHFTETHRMHLNHREKFRLCWESILTDDLKKSPQENDKLTLCSLSNEDPSPLFIVVLKIDDKAEFFSFCCIQVWGPETKKYKAEFSFVRHLPSSETEVLPGGSRRCKKYPLVCWALNVCTPLEAKNILKRGPIHLHIPTLTDMKFGDNPIDSIHINISLTT